MLPRFPGTPKPLLVVIVTLVVPDVTTGSVVKSAVELLPANALGQRSKPA